MGLNEPPKHGLVLKGMVCRRSLVKIKADVEFVRNKLILRVFAEHVDAGLPQDQGRAILVERCIENDKEGKFALRVLEQYAWRRYSVTAAA